MLHAVANLIIYQRTTRRKAPNNASPVDIVSTINHVLVILFEAMQNFARLAFHTF